MTEVIVARRFAGPARSGNGGWVSGLVAAATATTADAPAVTVRLSAPPPIDRPLRLDAGPDGTRLLDGDTLVASGVAAPVPAWSAPEPPSYAAAAAAAGGYPGLVDHPFPTCFACSPRRPADLGPGLALATGRVPAAWLDGHTGLPDDLHAAPWVPTEVDVPITWAALDCPGGWSAGIAGRPMVLGTMTAYVIDLPTPGDPHVVLAWPCGGSGRTFRSATALYATPEGRPGRLLARAESVWVTVDPAAFQSL